MGGTGDAHNEIPPFVFLLKPHGSLDVTKTSPVNLRVFMWKTKTPSET